jgi:hypothetical protein
LRTRTFDPSVESTRRIYKPDFVPLGPKPQIR